MLFSQTHEGHTWQPIPDAVLDKNLDSLKAVYMYAKIVMLRDKVYKREFWITNPISKKKEMSIDTMSFIVGRLEMADLIRINKLDIGNDWPVNSYEIVPQIGYYKPVYNDFINNPLLSADAKGLAILMSLLKDIPKSNRAIGKAIGFDGKTVKKYLAELEANGIYDKARRRLSADCFPYEVQCEEKRNKAVIEDYEAALSLDARSGGKAFSTRLKRQLDYIQNLEVSPLQKAFIWRKAEAGLLDSGNACKDIQKDRSEIIV